MRAFCTMEWSHFQLRGTSHRHPLWIRSSPCCPWITTGITGSPPRRFQTWAAVEQAEKIWMYDICHHTRKMWEAYGAWELSSYRHLELPSALLAAFEWCQGELLFRFNCPVIIWSLGDSFSPFPFLSLPSICIHLEEMHNCHEDNVHNGAYMTIY